MNDRELLQLAATVCTPNELDAFTLHHRGLSERTIAVHLNLSRSAVRSRLENARRKISQARKDAA